MSRPRSSYVADLVGLNLFEGTVRNDVLEGYAGSDDPVYSQGWFRVRLRSSAPGCHVGFGVRKNAGRGAGYGFSLIPTYGSCMLERHAPYARLEEHKPDIYLTMIETADIVAERYNVSREYQDEFGLRSQQLIHEAQQAG